MRQAAGLTDTEMAQFRDQGYLLVEGLLDPERDLDPILAEYAGVLDRLVAALYDAGELKSRYDDLTFNDRFTAVYRETGRTFAQHFDFTLPAGEISEDTPIWLGPAVFAALTNPRLLDLAESLVGPEILSSPIQHVRIKPPADAIANDTGALVASTPWHQDCGVVHPSADETDVVTMWFSLTDATIENGCLQVIPESHRDGMQPHTLTPAGPRINDKRLRLDRVTPVPTRRGDVLLLNKGTCHGSLSNNSKADVRVSFDIRYQPIGQPTGRDQFPGFIARSRTAPDSVLPDADAWAVLWHAARSRLAAMEEVPAFHRWAAEEVSASA